ncbi:hypothetical protein HanOQP8_Chr07g0260431 [Helianthus annuus]|nr:hypothetical protein HanHA89_Chr07g0270891 [Helianthus annuus]KAJ0732191.1 hypothetical protein HanOQP8_Chr07g0260431 [Helianthus annuus]
MFCYFTAFHISQLSPTGMVRIRHFEFVCRSQGEEPTIDKFRVFYQLQSNLGFFSFALRVVKKILITPPPPKSFHDWKMKFFFIREEVIPVDMEFRQSASIPKEDMRSRAGWLGMKSYWRCRTGCWRASTGRVRHERQVARMQRVCACSIARW